MPISSSIAWTVVALSHYPASSIAGSVLKLRPDQNGFSNKTDLEPGLLNTKLVFKTSFRHASEWLIDVGYSALPECGEIAPQKDVLKGLASRGHGTGSSLTGSSTTSGATSGAAGSRSARSRWPPRGAPSRTRRTGVRRGISPRFLTLL